MAKWAGQIRGSSLTVPDISVIIPTHNRARFLKEAIDSALAQTDCNVEIIVVDDASTDETPELLRSYGEAIHPILLSSNVERGAARNIGASNASAPLLAFLDSDDVWMPDKLSHQIPHVGPRVVCMTGVQRVSADGAPQGRPLVPRETNAPEIAFHNPFPAAPSSILIERALFDEAGGFIEDVQLQGSEDWHLLMKLILKLECRVHIVTAPLVHYREHDSNSIADPNGVARSMWGVVHRASRDGLITEHQSVIALARTAQSLARQFAYHGDRRSRSKWLVEAVKDASAWRAFHTYARVHLSATKGRVDRLARRLRGILR